MLISPESRRRLMSLAETPRKQRRRIPRRLKKALLDYEIALELLERTGDYINPDEIGSFELRQQVWNFLHTYPEEPLGD